MTSLVSEKALTQLSTFIAERTALYFPPARWNDLARKAQLAAKAFEFSDVEEFSEWIVNAALRREQLELFVSHLTVGETYFWREEQSLEILIGRILPELIRQREKDDRRIRIWSAGCSSGEEAYSIAIAIRRNFPDLSDWCVHLLATDINPQMLQKALSGVYREWSFRNTPSWLKKQYFQVDGEGNYKILPKIQEMVHFEHLNLALDPYPSLLNNTNAMDVIFCRNVLMYFSPEHTQKIVARFHASLLAGGWLIVGASELSQQLFPQFKAVPFPNMTLYRKAATTLHPVEKNAASPTTALAAEGEKLTLTFPVIIEERKTPPAPAPPKHAPPPQKYTPPAPPVKEVEKIEASPPPALSIEQAIAHMRALANAGQLEEALVLCEDTLATEKLNAVLHYMRATILQELHRDEQAAASLQRTLYLEPDFVLAHFSLANLAIQHGEHRKAKRCLENLLRILERYEQDAIVAESEGLTAGRFKEMVRATIQMETLQ